MANMVVKTKYPKNSKQIMLADSQMVSFGVIIGNEGVTADSNGKKILKAGTPITGDIEARNILIERNLRLVAHIAKKYSWCNLEQDDLISIGTIGLIKGINSFKMNKNIKLATYTARCIENEILMILRSSKKTNAEVFLNEPIGKDKDDNVVTLQEVLENNERNIEDEVDLKLKIKKLYEKIKTVLKNKEKFIIELRFGLDGSKPKTQKEIAQMLNISRSYVSRIETKAIGKLAKEIKD